MEIGDGSDKWNETGCFVYQLLGPVGVSSGPTADDDNYYRTERSFCEGELVAIDLVRHSRTKPTDVTKRDGPFLRLADSSGWMFERKKGEMFMKRLPIEVGLWVLYADNYPVGIHLRNHPIDLMHKFTVTNLLLKPNVSILPMQKMYCDRKVTADNGVNFYRVQGIDNAWVFDKRIMPSGEDDHFMLLPENKVRTGLFAYRALDHVGIRATPNVSKKSKTALIVRPGDLVVGDVVRESPSDAKHGPFLRLTDASGWLFERKNNSRLMEEVHITTGQWRFCVVRATGIQLMKQPIIDKAEMFSKKFEQKEEVVCDRMIASPVGASFFRVEGTDGWVFDKHDGDIMMEIISADRETSGIAGWSPDYVRGMATAIEGLREVSFNDSSRILSFRNDDNVVINVYYSTRTVGTAVVHPTQGKTQLFRRECSGIELLEIFKNPRTHTGRGYQKKAIPVTSSDGSVGSGFPAGSGFKIGVEEELRNSVFECDEEMERLSERRAALFKSIVIHSVKRRIYGNRMNDRRMKHDQFLEDKRRKALSCQHCNRLCESSSALKKHICDTSGNSCHVCGKTYSTSGALNRHRDAAGHY